VFVMHYGGQKFELSSQHSLAELEKAARVSEPTWTTIRFQGEVYGRFLLGGGIPVAFTGLSQNDIPPAYVTPAPISASDGGFPLGTDRMW